MGSFCHDVSLDGNGEDTEGRGERGRKAVMFKMFSLLFFESEDISGRRRGEESGGRLSLISSCPSVMSGLNSALSQKDRK